MFIVFKVLKTFEINLNMVLSKHCNIINASKSKYLQLVYYH